MEKAPTSPEVSSGVVRRTGVVELVGQDIVVRVPRDDGPPHGRADGGVLGQAEAVVQVHEEIPESRSQGCPESRRPGRRTPLHVPDGPRCRDCARFSTPLPSVYVATTLQVPSLVHGCVRVGGAARDTFDTRSPLGV